ISSTGTIPALPPVVTSSTAIRCTTAAWCSTGRDRARLCPNQLCADQSAQGIADEEGSVRKIFGFDEAGFCPAGADEIGAQDARQEAAGDRRGYQQTVGLFDKDIGDRPLADLAAFIQKQYFVRVLGRKFGAGSLIDVASGDLVAVHGILGREPRACHAQ